ncbi:predicted protein [Postia placenta Mad-698-R]|uniref:Uncharacterized protein n=1 Tax=Postia placenta MAD-698-R-SB12 TaxID=670580 RepID=A0A1X6N020_9APHY|nr:hypothetical protein POSPLADRAFT_1046454 [Postia placenta MAD-698-R-SB12]EED82693.1 predicted protein [Postia placenta Mad-698-R]OSX61955.1 hypothetical protein POSPLADRAFT_1046454 [Postia placenta MAD-698-R-SB12]
MCSIEPFLDKLDVPLASLMATSGDEQPVGIAVDESCWKPGIIRMCAEAESMDTVSPMDTLLDPSIAYWDNASYSPASHASDCDSPVMGMDVAIDASDAHGILPWPGCKKLPAQPQRHSTNQTPETRKNQQLLSLLVKATTAACLSYLIPLYCDARNQSTKISHQRMVIPNLLRKQATHGAKREPPEEDDYVERPPKKTNAHQTRLMSDCVAPVVDESEFYHTNTTRYYTTGTET